MKAFVVGALKIAAALTVTCLVLGAVGWGIYSFNERRETAINAPLETPKAWAPLTIGALDGATVSLSTVWHKSSVSYKFELRGKRQPGLKSAPLDVRESPPEKDFTLVFSDANGFKISDYAITASEGHTVVDESGKRIGFSAKGNIYMSADDYRRIALWEITWR